MFLSSFAHSAVARKGDVGALLGLEGDVGRVVEAVVLGVDPLDERLRLADRADFQFRPHRMVTAEDDVGRGSAVRVSFCEYFLNHTTKKAILPIPVPAGIQMLFRPNIRPNYSAETHSAKFPHFR